MRIRIDGQLHDVTGETTLLPLLRRLGHDVPSLCHDPRLAPRPACRLCVVEIAGVAEPVPSCATVVVDGMDVRTVSPALDAHRRVTLESLVRHQPADALRDPSASELARLAHRFGVADAAGAALHAVPVDDAHPYIHVDMRRCIDCYRCVRVCNEVQGQFVWQVWDRGDRTVIRPDSGSTLLASSCVACGACVTACPSGALQDQATRTHGSPSVFTRSVCPYCGVGCEIEVGTRDGRITQVLPPLDAPVNKGHLCVKGRYAYAFAHADDRLRTPLLRDGADWRAVSWPDALAWIAERLRRIVARHGADAVAVLGSARATNEENYVAQKFARVALGTNNVDCCARVCHAPSAAALGEVFGTGAATSAFDDIELARTILVCGANATEAHPVIGARIHQRALAGANLIVIDPRRIELARVPGALHLPLHPGANVAVLNAMACAIVEAGLVNEPFVQARVDAWPAFRAHVLRYRPEDVGPPAGVSPALLREAARRYAAGGPAIAFHGLGATEHVQGTDAVIALANLALLTGNVGQPGSGVNPLRGQNNVQGSAVMGCEPGQLTGAAAIATAAPRFAAAWGAPMPTRPGLRLPAMMQAAARGELKALWAMGYDVLLTNPTVAETARGLAALELLIVQDIFLNETARAHAHVVLPAASGFEKDGTFMNAERRIQRVRAAIAPPGEAQPDWMPLCAVARLLGHGEGFAFTSAAAIWDEVRALWPAVRGITYERLEHGGLQWPCPDVAHPGTPRLHAQAFTTGPRAALRCLEHHPSPEATSDDYPLLLVTGRSLHHFNAGTMTMRTASRVLRAGDRLDISAVDAARYGLVEGDRVRVESRYGAATLPLHVDEAPQAGELFATFNEPASWLNRLTGPYRDARTDTPEYKRTAVRIAKVDGR